MAHSMDAVALIPMESFEANLARCGELALRAFPIRTLPLIDIPK